MTFIIKSALVLTLSVAVGCATPVGRDDPVANNFQAFSINSYAVEPTNVLRIDIFQEEELSNNYYVDPSGTINFPLIGRIQAAGQTVQQIESRIKSALAHGYIVDPNVRVSVIKYRPIYISGEVKKPGEYPFTPGMTAQQAVTLAGGPTRFAAEKYYVQRSNLRINERMRVTADNYLFPGDVVSLDERLF